jgi:NitT/TauT family transport system permease protein
MKGYKNLSYDQIDKSTRPGPNAWDIIILILLVCVIVALGISGKAMLSHFDFTHSIYISLSPKMLPYYALRTIARMLLALLFSLLFTFIFGTWAAKSHFAERIIIPAIDILQSVPVLGYLSITVTGFMLLFPNRMLGPECASIFAIFTAQVWNMTLSLYQSLRILPSDLREAGLMFQLSPWQRFWKIEVPFAMPGLLWNSMMSMSGSWVFLVLSEAITVNNHNITLPGIGSYIAVAIQQSNMHAIIYVIFMMFLVILLYDQLLFRPLVAWSEKFKTEAVAGENTPKSWMLYLLQRTAMIKLISIPWYTFTYLFINFGAKNYASKATKITKVRTVGQQKIRRMIWNLVVCSVIAGALFLIIEYLQHNVTLNDIKHVVFLGSITAIRVIVLIILSSIVWVPVGVWIGLHPKLSLLMQPVVQFLAAFPATLLYPLFVLVILKYNLNPNIWVSPLMILGVQWYILFNVVAATLALPVNLLDAAATLSVRGWLWWKRIILPGIFPYFVTGAITAAGGAWNMSIVAEALSWGKHVIYAQGLGAYISVVTAKGDYPKIALGIIMMSMFVLLFNYVIWRPLYKLSERFH